MSRPTTPGVFDTNTEPVNALAVLDAELARADASAVSTASAAAHSLRDAAGKAKQQQTADAARARADSMRAVRAAVAELIAAQRMAHDAMLLADWNVPGKVSERKHEAYLASAAALARIGAP